MTSSATGDDGPVGGQDMRKARNLLQSSVLYMEAERFGRSTKLWKNIEPAILEPLTIIVT